MLTYEEVMKVLKGGIYYEDENLIESTCWEIWDRDPETGLWYEE